MKWLWMLLLAGTVGSLRAQYSLPEGFIVYSKGNDSQRTLYRVDVHPGDTPEQIAATERKICEKGAIGDDIEGQISFDGKWLAFARTVAKTTKGKGNNDYHDYDKWEIYVVRIDGTLPAEPIRIGPGYFPSWSDDSDQEVKTLYYTYEKERSIRQVTIDDRGKVLKEGQHFAIVLTPRKRFSPRVTVFFPEAQGEAIVDAFGARLPMEEVRLDVLDRLIKFLRI